MVRFTLLDRIGSARLRMELRPADSVREISCVASEYWGQRDFLLRNGYSLLREDVSIGDCISDGDTVEIVPDPDGNGNLPRGV